MTYVEAGNEHANTKRAAAPELRAALHLCGVSTRTERVALEATEATRRYTGSGSEKAHFWPRHSERMKRLRVSVRVREKIPEGASIGGEPGHGHADVIVDGENLLLVARELRRRALRVSGYAQRSTDLQCGDNGMSLVLHTHARGALE